MSDGYDRLVQRHFFQQVFHVSQCNVTVETVREIVPVIITTTMTH